MKIISIFSFLLFIFGSINVSGQKKWKASPFEQKVFVENKGQFDENTGVSEKIFFQAVSGGVKMYFTKQGLVYHYDEVVTNKEGAKKKEEREAELKVTPHSLSMQWLGSNPAVEITAEDKVSFFYTYAFDPKKQNEGIKASAYKKIIYHNLYPNIDAEYILPEDKTGVEYSLILHPGSSLSDVKMKWGGEKISQDASGNIVIKSSFGDFIDHAPKTFYENTHQNIASSFSLKNNIVSFSLPDGENHSNTSTIIIDPWTKSTTFTTDRAFDVSYDNAGNVYAYGSQLPNQLVKFNSAGTLQWVFSATSLLSVLYPYYGDFAVDAKSGSCYVGKGYPGSLIAKVNTNTGAQVALYPGNPNMSEIWRMDYNPCDGTIIGAGGSNGGSPPGNGFILDTNLVTINTVSISNIQHVDVTLLAIDKYNSSFCYMLYAKFGSYPAWDNALVKCPLPGFVPTTWSTLTTHTFQELFSVTYVSGNGSVGPTNAMNGIAVSPGFVYTYDGGIIKKWNKNTGAFVSSLTVSPTLFSWGGMDVDACDNLYVGVQNAINVYDANWNSITTYPLSATIYDLKLGGTKLYACGDGFVSEIDITPPACNQQSQINLTPSATNSSCGGSTGTASVIANGGNAPYTYVWNPGGQTTSTATGLSPGNYTVTVTDSPSTCSPAGVQTATVTITGAGNFSVTATPTNISCNGAADGSGTITAAGGTSPYSYLWNPNGATTSATTGLSSGTYTVTVTDVSGCTSTQTITITEPTALTTSTSATTASCGVNDGSVNINAAGGTPNYTYSWNPSGQTTQTATGLLAGSYTVTVTDASGCTKTDIANVSNTGQPIINISPSINVSCNGGSNGSAIVNITVGTPAYTYLWSSGQTTSAISGLAPGNYQVTVKDANGCIAIISTTITEPTVLTASVSATQVSCSGGNNGSSTVTASGGTPSYTYLWNPSGQTTSVATGLSSGNYTVTITDANSCTNTTTVSIVQPGPFTSSILATNNACNGGPTGTAAVSPSGGTGPYGYNWNPSGQTTQTATGLSPGNYSATVTDTKGCTSAATATVSNTVVTAVINPVAGICAGGTATLTASGGTNYVWSNGNTGSTITVSPTSNSTYSVVVSSGACSDIASASVTISPGPSVSILGNTALCKGDATTLTASGGTNYSWSNGISTSSISVSPSSNTTYSVTAANANGCTSTTSVSVTVSLPPHATIAGVNTICAGKNTTLTATGGGNYLWNTGESTASITISPSATSTYSVIVSVGSCKDSAKYIVTVQPSPVATAASNVVINIGDQTTLTATGGGTYSWSPATGLSCSNCSNPVASPLQTTEYCVYVKDAAGCTDSACVTVTVDINCKGVYLPNAFSPNGDGENDVLYLYGNCIVEMKLEIYNRWGQKVYEGTDPKKGWDGLYNGVQENTAVFDYYLTYTLITGEQGSKKGNISLVR